MTEKRYKYNKYVYCYCSKNDQVLVGTEAYMYLNAYAVLIGVALIVWELFSDGGLTFIVIFGIPMVIVPLYNYRASKKTMLQSGHSEECSRKIARMVTYRASLWGDKLKIMKDKDDNKRSWR